MLRSTLAASAIGVLCAQTALGATLGGTEATAAFSALQIQQNGASLGDGLYWIDPDGAGGEAAFQIYADMTTFGGGWTLGLVSRENDQAASADMIANTGTPGANSTHTRDLSHLVIDQDAQIRHVITDNGQVVFDGYYTGNYHGTFAAAASVWTVLVGDANILGYHFGMAWSTADNDQDSSYGNCATSDGAWYYRACWTAHPAPLGLDIGPYVSAYGFVDQWQIFVRETSSPAIDGVVPLPASALLLLGGIAGLGLLRRRAA